ncbi:MAG: peptide chain release factor N(5)-glutamine methyltransferase [Alphaproteobacteria bacterium]|nr:peptide chain release factor N(5)-glutamine methyltransferase [Alphaproteobacteria bacterium]
MTLAEVLEKSAGWLKQRGVDSPRLDAELLAAHALGLDRIGLFLQLDKPLSPEELTAVRALVARRGEREPLAWITGSKGFHAIDLLVRPGVLVPRPDTETLVDAILARTSPDAELFVADVGCGSGAIGLALAHARPALKVYAIDRAEEPLACTRDNVAALELAGRVAVLRGDLLQPVPPHRPIDIVVSNPPYIATAVLAGLAPEVRAHEPRGALDGGADGLDVYRRLVPMAAQRARIGVAVEIGHDQGRAVAALFQRAGLQGVRVLRDLAGRDRVVLGTVPGAAWPVDPTASQGERVVELVEPEHLADDDAPVVIEPLDDGDDDVPRDEEGNPLPSFDADR